MSHPPTSRMSTFIVIAALLAPVSQILADDLPGCGGFPVWPSVTPAQPGCADVVTLGATQWLTDSCWTAAAPIFDGTSPDFSFELESLDLWTPGMGCLHVLLEIPFTRQVGPLPAGPYSLTVTHRSTSPRQGDAACEDRIEFDVTCCAAVPDEASGLRLNLVSAGSEIWLNWDDVAGADDYVIYGAGSPNGTFTEPLQTGVNGAAGAGLPVATAPGFFLIGARNDCGVGTRH